MGLIRFNSFNYEFIYLIRLICIFKLLIIIGIIVSNVEWRKIEKSVVQIALQTKRRPQPTQPSSGSRLGRGRWRVGGQLKRIRKISRWEIQRLKKKLPKYNVPISSRHYHILGRRETNRREIWGGCEFER